MDNNTAFINIPGSQVVNSKELDANDQDLNSKEGKENTELHRTVLPKKNK